MSETSKSGASKLGRMAAVAAVGTLGALMPVGAASAATYPSGGPPPEVQPTTTQVAPNQVARTAATLPLTGTDVAELVAIGGASVGAGLLLVRRSRAVRPTA